MAKSTTVVINPPNLQIIEVKVFGTTSLICNQFSEKAIRMIEDKQQKKAAKAREAKDPQADYEGSLYKLSDGTFGFPAVGFKCSAVRASKMVGMAMTDTRQMFHVIADEGELVKINGMPSMRRDMVRLQGSTADVRYRGEFRIWDALLRVQFNADVISEEQLCNLFNLAGFSVGIGEWRPEKNGINGCFTLIEQEAADWNAAIA